MCQGNDERTVCGIDITPFLLGDEVKWSRKNWCQACMKTVLRNMARERYTKADCGKGQTYNIRRKKDKLMRELDLVWPDNVVSVFMAPKVTHLLGCIWKEQIAKHKILTLGDDNRLGLSWPESVRNAWMAETWDGDIFAGTGRKRANPPQDIDLPSDHLLRFVQDARNTGISVSDVSPLPTPAESVAPSRPPTPPNATTFTRQSRASESTGGEAQAGSLATAQLASSSRRSIGLGTLTPTVQDLTTASSVQIREADSQDATIQLDPPTRAGTRSRPYDLEAASTATPTTSAPTMQSLGVDTQASSIAEDAPPTPTPASRTRPVVQPQRANPNTSFEATLRMQDLERELHTLRQQVRVHQLTPPQTPLVSRVNFPQTPTHQPTRQAAHHEQDQAADEGFVNVPTESEERLNRAIMDYHRQVRDGVRAVQLKLARPKPSRGRTVQQYIDRLREILRGELREVVSAEAAVERERREGDGARHR